MEEKVQYQSEERIRDIQDQLASLETKISRMEHQQVCTLRTQCVPVYLCTSVPLSPSLPAGPAPPAGRPGGLRELQRPGPGGEGHQCAAHTSAGNLVTLGILGTTCRSGGEHLEHFIMGVQYMFRTLY